MKKKLLALVCALALTFSLAGCVISTPDTVGKIGDFEVTSGMYLLAQYGAYQQAAQLAGTDQDATDVKAFLKETITTDSDSGDTAVVSDYVADQTQKTLETLAAVDARFKELGGKLTDEQISSADSYAQQMMDNYGDTYTANGIGLETLKAFERLQLEHTRQAHDYLLANQGSHITLAELAARFHLSQSSLKICFKALYGVPVASYLRGLRMDTAANLLRSSDLPVAEIAHRVGYEDPSRFAAAFRRHTGCRPTELRRVPCPTPPENESDASA